MAREHALAGYVRHAERFGVEDVFETATVDLDARDLGRLSLRLQNIDAKWRPPSPGGFALRLLDAGFPDPDVCRMAKISRSTLWRLQHEQGTPKCAPEPAFQSGESVSNPTTPMDGTSEPIQTAAGVSVDHRRAA